MADYKTIDGVKYDKSMLEAADEAIAGVGDGRVSYEDAKLIWADVMEDGKVTKVEIRTVKYILDNYKCTDKGREYLEGQVYRNIGGKMYDLALLQTADKLTAGAGDGRISFDDAGLIWGLVDADGKVSDVEARTVGYILENYKVTDKAKEFLLKQLG
jgi:uncharacterized tellurite resistance protein B-like protein